MNDLSIDIGYKSINHFGETLCGDHVDIVDSEHDSSKIIVLADGLRSGVKASILSTLTSKIISRMLAKGMPLAECVYTVADTLPVSSEYGVAYSTFTIARIIDNEQIELIQYENPDVIFIRDGKKTEYLKTARDIGGKTIYRSLLPIMEGDMLVLMSDGCPNASPDITYNMDWDENAIADFVSTVAVAGYTSKAIADMLVLECYKLYDEKPIDDTTACVLKVIKRQQVNVLFGPPRNRDDGPRMMSLFFSKAGKHIICGGTTSEIAAEYLGKKCEPCTKYPRLEGPPMSEIEGVDMVTEGIITMEKILNYAKIYCDSESGYDDWSKDYNAATFVARVLFEEATDIDIFVGQAANPAHQDMQDLNFNVKMSIISDLADYLRKMEKNVKLSYF